MKEVYVWIKKSDQDVEDDQNAEVDLLVIEIY